MHKLSRVTLTSIMIAVTVVVWPQAPSPQAKVELVPGSVVDADDKVVQEILGTFSKADEALGTGDLDGLMNLYSKTYNYHRLTKSDMRKFSAPKNPQRIPPNTSPVFCGLRSRICPPLLRLVTNGNVGQAPCASCVKREA